MIDSNGSWHPTFQSLLFNQGCPRILSYILNQHPERIFIIFILNVILRWYLLPLDLKLLPGEESSLENHCSKQLKFIIYTTKHAHQLFVYTLIYIHFKNLIYSLVLAFILTFLYLFKIKFRSIIWVFG